MDFLLINKISALTLSEKIYFFVSTYLNYLLQIETYKINTLNNKEDNDNTQMLLNGISNKATLYMKNMYKGKLSIENLSGNYCKDFYKYLKYGIKKYAEFDTVVTQVQL